MFHKRKKNSRNFSIKFCGAYFLKQNLGEAVNRVFFENGDFYWMKFNSIYKSLL